MKKYRLREFRLTDYAQNRQEQRKMTDYEIEKVLNFGTPLPQADGRIAYQLGPQMVVIDPVEKKIITVYAGDRPHSPPKLQIVKSPEENQVREITPEEVFLADVIPLRSSQDQSDETEIDAEEYMSGEYHRKSA